MSRAKKILQNFERLSSGDEDKAQKTFDKMKAPAQRKLIKKVMSSAKLSLGDFDLDAKDMKATDQLFFDGFPSKAMEAIANSLLESKNEAAPNNFKVGTKFKDKEGASIEVTDISVSVSGSGKPAVTVKSKFKTKDGKSGVDSNGLDAFISNFLR